MNFKITNTNAAQKIGHLNKLVLVLFFAAACSPKSKLNDVNGDVQVKIPVSSQSGDSSKYQLSVVTLKSLSNLKEVTGQFAQFFFAPGLENQTQLVGDSPQARFVRTKDNTYIPADSLSQQMATLYYHIQNLSEFSKTIGAGDINKQPMKIGLETKVGGSQTLEKNNAFYDGQSDAMLFVPFSSSELPIAVNSGIIAHEYFHSLFYKIVLKSINVAKSDVSTQKIQPLYNETYLRGINEGLADFWGWAYTNDEDFIHWSLSAYSGNRKLVLENSMIGQFENSENIFSKVQVALLSGSSPSEYLSEYIYKIGTPNARYLKQLTMMMVSGDVTSAQAKVQVAGSVLLFLNSLVDKTKALATTEILPAESLFDFMSSENSKIKLNKSQCEFTLSYIQKNELRATDSCVKQTDGTFQIKPEIKEPIQ